MRGAQAHSRRNPGNKPMAVTKDRQGETTAMAAWTFLLGASVLLGPDFCLPQQTSYCYCCNHTVQREGGKICLVHSAA